MKTVLITGGSRGIGAATARRFAAAGYRVAITYNRSEREALELAEELGGTAVRADVGDPDQVQAMVDNADEMLGRAGYEAKQIEGTRNSSWVLMDYGDMIIHIFDEENRLFYDLERIWRDGKILDAEEFLGENE